MVMSKQENNSTEAFTDILFNRDGIPDLFMQNCPHCYSENIELKDTTKPKIMGRELSIPAKTVKRVFLRLMGHLLQAWILH